MLVDVAETFIFLWHLGMSLLVWAIVAVAAFLVLAMVWVALKTLWLKARGKPLPNPWLDD